MNYEQMKHLLERDKLFLKELFESNSVPNSRRILQFASDSKLDTLSKFLNLISNGIIKIKHEHFNVMQNRHLRVIKKHFEKKQRIKDFLKMERKEKLKILNKFCDVYSALLYTLFNEI